jgi:LAO/AO transport system kinase
VLNDLVTRFQQGDTRALAQAISLAERDDPRLSDLLKALGARPALARSVGLTGAPGAGKSTLVDALVRAARHQGRTVGVLAVDPSSPFSGGALLGDRFRMDAHLLDRGVFVRSMAARGILGGMAPAAGEAIWLLSAFGFDEVIVETVGIGQSELELSVMVDTTVVVLTPGMGDDLQLEKAGIMEIADVFVVNKADRPGADRLAHDVRVAMTLAPSAPWQPPVVKTVACEPAQGIDEVWEAVNAHRAHVTTDAAGQASSSTRLRKAAAAFVANQARTWALDLLDANDAMMTALELHRQPTAVGRDLCELAGFGSTAGDRRGRRVRPEKQTRGEE